MHENRVRARRALLRAAVLRHVVGAALLICWLPVGAGAQGWGDDWDDEAPRRYEDEAPPRYDGGGGSGWGVNLGFGFTESHETFLVDFGIPYTSDGGVSIGPRIQIGLADRRDYVAGTLAFEYAHDLRGQVSGPLENLQPLIHAGIGFGWLEEENRPGDDSDAGFLVDIGFGVAYRLSEAFSLASVFDFNVLPKETLDENLVFSWQILQLRARF